MSFESDRGRLRPPCPVRRQSVFRERQRATSPPWAARLCRLALKTHKLESRQQRLNRAPFEVAQVISAHTDPGSEFGTIWKPPVGKQPVSDLKGVSDDAPKQSFN